MKEGVIAEARVRWLNAPHSSAWPCPPWSDEGAHEQPHASDEKHVLLFYKHDVGVRHTATEQADTFRSPASLSRFFRQRFGGIVPLRFPAILPATAIFPEQQAVWPLPKEGTCFSGSSQACRSRWLQRSRMEYGAASNTRKQRNVSGRHAGPAQSPAAD